MVMKSLLLPFFINLIILTTTAGQVQSDQPTSYLDDLDFSWIADSDTINLFARNKLVAPIELILSDRETGKETRSVLLPPMDTVLVTQVMGNDPESVQAEFGQKTRLSYFIGHPDAIVPDTQYMYRFPFKSGKKYELSQGWNGKRTHKSDQSRYAFDFQLNVGEPVHAARAGLVVKAIGRFTRQGGAELRNAANRIVILHEDGTLATYAHLAYRGVLVKPGDRVETGQQIGISGLTGFTSGPHLHFVVRKERDIAIPIYFEGHAGKVLRQGKRYKVR